MAITFVVDPERRRVSTRADGLITLTDIAAHVEAEQRQRSPSFDELFDATGATINMTAAEVQSMVRVAGDARQQGPLGATAIVATEPAVFGLARMFAILCEGVGVKVEVFRTAAEAQAWLDAIAGAGPRPAAGGEG